jgi:hypothetical protein
MCPADRHPDGENVNIDVPSASQPYSGFHRFRVLLAAEDGIDLESMAGFAKAGLPWAEASTTLAPLLNHSDCDGELTPAECSAILPRLKEIRLTWGSTGASRDLRHQWDVEHLDALINVATYCATVGVNLDFH